MRIEPQVREELILAAKAAIRAAEMTVELHAGLASCSWTIRGFEVAACEGIPIPSMHQLPHVKSQRCWALRISWKTFLSPEMQQQIEGELIPSPELGLPFLELDKPCLSPLEDEIEAWINQENILARKVIFRGRLSTTHGVWNSRTKRWRISRSH